MAARGVLGSCLMTEMVFTASLAEWKEIIRQRNNPAADDEIHEIAVEIQEILKAAFPERGF